MTYVERDSLNVDLASHADDIIALFSVANITRGGIREVAVSRYHGALMKPSVYRGNIVLSGFKGDLNLVHVMPIGVILMDAV